jgi:hypothetical protein
VETSLPGERQETFGRKRGNRKRAGSEIAGLTNCPNAAFSIQVFSDIAASAADAEGKTFLLGATVNTNAAGVGNFAFAALATRNLGGDTSEFSAAVQVN